MSLVTALQAMTIATSRPDELGRLLSAGLGWECVGSHAIHPGHAQVWGIGSDAVGEVAVIYRSPGSDRGWIRVVSGHERLRRRPMAARWAGVEMVVGHDIDDLHARLTRTGDFRTFVPPSDWDWTEYGSNVHRAFIGHGPGGTHLAFTQKLTQPRGRLFPAAEAQVGHVFDVPLIVTAFDACKDFYTQALGMRPILESSLRDHLWHRLWRIPPDSPVKLDIYKGDAAGTGLGGIELQGYEPGLVDPEPAEPGRLDGGACMVTYTSFRIDDAYAAVAGHPLCRTWNPPRPIEGFPYAGAQAFVFQGPAGERVEVIEQGWSVPAAAA